MNITRKTLEETSKISENEYECPFCARIYPDLDSLTSHVECDHNYEIQSVEDNLSKASKENLSTLEKWKAEKKISILQNATPSELELYSNDKMAFERRLEDEYWRLALKQQARLSTLDTKIMDSLQDKAIKFEGRCPEGYTLVEVEGVKMCIPSHILNEMFQYRAEKRDKEAEYEKTKKEYGEEWNSKENLSQEAKALIWKKFLESKRTKNRKDSN